MPLPISGIASDRFRRVAVAGSVLAGCGLLIALAWHVASPDPRHAFQQAWHAYRRGDVEAVARAATALESQATTRSAARVLDAALLLSDGDAAGALNVLPRNPIARPYEPYRLLIAGQCYYRLGDLHRAWQAFRAALAVDPQNPDALRWLAAVHFDLGSYDAALPLLQRLTTLEPHDFAPWRLMGVMYLDFEKYGAAADAFTEALKRNPPAAIADEIRLDLVHCLIKQNDFAAAQQVLASCGPSPRREILACEIRWATGAADDALHRIQRMCQQYPDRADAWRLLGRIAVQQARWEDAAAAFQRVVQLEPFEPDGYYNLARIAARHGDLQRAAQWQERFEQLQQMRRRLTKLNTQASRDPNAAAVREELARLCEQLGKPELARMWRRAATAIRQLSRDRATPRSGQTAAPAQ